MTEEKCKHDGMASIGAYFAQPSTSPEAKCLCKNGVRGKHCFDYHPAEARVDWEKEARKIARIFIGNVRIKNGDMSGFEDMWTEEITKALSAAFEKGRELK